MPENTQNAEPSFEEILQFDPFNGEAEGEIAPPESKDDAAAAAPPPGDSGEETGGAGAKSQQPQQPPTAPAPAPSPPPTPALTQADLTAAMSRLADAVRPQPQQQAPQLRFNMGIPDELTSALRSEDPGQFKAGVGALVNSLANHIWSNFQQDVQQNLVPAIRQMLESHTSAVSQQESVGRDFYGTYPGLNRPELAPLIQTVGAQLAREAVSAGRSLDWSPQLRDEIASRVFTIIGGVQPPQAAAAPAPRRPFSTGNGTRPTQATATPADDMQAMIFGRF
jgi:hypothetical protein